MSNPSFQTVEIDRLKESPLNPRSHYDEKKILELAESIKGVGIIEPLVVRNGKKDGMLELVAGSRRLRAAKLAELKEIPVLVRELTDVQMLEIMVIENNQREDVNALEEAEGYSRLLKTGKEYKIALLAQKIGQSTKYVYDRLKLLELVPEAKKLVLAGKMTAGHAILLARLAPKDQERALDVEGVGYNRDGGLFAYERDLFDRNHGKDEVALAKYHGYKARSVRELEDWIDRHVRFNKDVTAVDPMLFPETKGTLLKAFEEKEKVVQITHNLQTPEDAREGNKERIFHASNWKRADGSSKEYKTCDKSVTGVVVVGEERGAAYKVCLSQSGCDVHWKKEKRERARFTRGASAGGDAAKIAEQTARQKAEEERRKREAEQWEKALQEILEACCRKVKAAKFAVLLEVVKRLIHGQWELRRALPAAAKLVPYIKTIEDIGRFVALVGLVHEATEYDARREFPKRAQQLGVDVPAILAEFMPKEEKVQTAARGDGKEGGAVDSVKTPKAKKPKKGKAKK